MNLIFTSVGGNFRPAETRDLIKSLSPGTAVALVPEGDNPYDDHAVQVCYDDVHIGFVPKTDNRALFEALSAGAPYTASIIGFESSIKPVVEVEIAE